MNRLTLILPALLLIILVGCRVGQSAAIDIDVSKSPTPSGEASESPIPSSEIKYISETSVEDCYLFQDIAQLEITDRYYGDKFLIPWTISNGVAVADKSLLIQTDS